MGRRGPAPRPTALKVIEGNPGKRPLNTREPKPRPVAPKPPPWLDRDAKREWRRVAPELERLGLLSHVDMAALAAYCQAFSRWAAAERIIAQEGLTCRGAMGGMVQRPEVLIARQSMQLIKQFAGEFGLTPAGRTRLTLPEPDTDDLDALLAAEG